jgi:hypothetical protein
MKKLASLVIAIAFALAATAPAMACYQMNCNGPTPQHHGK